MSAKMNSFIEKQTKDSKENYEIYKSVKYINYAETDFQKMQFNYNYINEQKKILGLKIIEELNYNHAK